MIVTFCGHSYFSRTEEYERVVLLWLSNIVGEKRADFYLGGYGAFDGFAYDCCKKYQQTHPNVSLVFVTPYMSVGYQKKQLRDKLARYDNILYPEIEDKPLKYAISYRNQWMVEKADYVISYIMHGGGGSYAMYRYAMRKGKRVFNLGTFEEKQL